MRPDLPGQGRDLALVAHPHLEHRIFDIARHSGEAERHAGVVVVALHRTMDLPRPVAVERGIERFLRAGFSNRARHPEDLRSTALARCSAKRLERRERVVDQDVGAVNDWHRDDGPGRSCRKGALNEPVPIQGRPRHCNEEVASLHFAAVEGDTGNFERRADGAAGCGSDFV